MKTAAFLAVASMLCFSAIGCAGGGSTALTPGPPGPKGSPTVPPGITKIQHIVIIVQENRSVDNLFNGLPGADTVTSGKNSQGGTVNLAPVPFEAGYDPRHLHNDFVTEYNGGAMNGFDKVGINPNPGYTIPPNAAYGYVPRSETVPYFQLAERFAFADEMFQTNEGPSFPAHQYLISGSSVPAAGSPYKVSENIINTNRSPKNGGCDAPAGATTYLIDQFGNENNTIFPCLERQTLVDLLDADHVKWRYYTPSYYYVFSAIDAIRHLRYGPDWVNVTVPETKIFKDITKGTLPAVSWVVPTGGNSDHSGNLSNAGPSWVASVTNAIGTSPYWDSTAIFVTWDDWGGWYDHTKPQILNSYELSFRVPLLVISPYARPGYVSHAPHEFGSILKFVEERFNLGSLGYTDARADDLSDCFDFNQAPLHYQIVQAPYSRSYLLSHWKFEPPDSD